jgi:hypothetical protein
MGGRGVIFPGSYRSGASVLVEGYRLQDSADPEETSAFVWLVNWPI